MNFCTIHNTFTFHNSQLTPDGRHHTHTYDTVLNSCDPTSKYVAYTADHARHACASHHPALAKMFAWRPCRQRRPTDATPHTHTPGPPPAVTPVGRRVPVAFAIPQRPVNNPAWSFPHHVPTHPGPPQPRTWASSWLGRDGVATLVLCAPAAAAAAHCLRHAARQRPRPAGRPRAHPACT